MRDAASLALVDIDRSALMTGATGTNRPEKAAFVTDPFEAGRDARDRFPPNARFLSIDRGIARRRRRLRYCIPPLCAPLGVAGGATEIRT